MDKFQKDDLLWAILHGHWYGFTACRVIAEALSFKKRIPKRFWQSDEHEIRGMIDVKDFSKPGLYKLREEIVSAIV